MLIIYKSYSPASIPCPISRIWARDVGVCSAQVEIGGKAGVCRTTPAIIIGKRQRIAQGTVGVGMVGKGKQDALGGLPRTCADLRASQEREVVQDADTGEVGHLFGGQHHAKPAFGGKVTAGAGDEVLKGQDGSMAGSGTGGDWRKGVFTKKGRIGQDDVETLVTLPSAQVGLYNIYYRGKGGTPHILTGLAYSLRIYFHTHNVLRATLGSHQGKDAGAGAHVEYGEGGRLRRKNCAVSA